ncbi:MAG: glycosyltransferase [bacterium]|nr:glycosyltransferase [bacterium]
MKAEANYQEPAQSLEEENPPNPNIFLSVIVSISREQNQIDETLDLIKDYLQTQRFNSEILVVDRGNYDQTTEVITDPGRYIYEFKEQRSTRVKRNIEHLGQGFSLSRSLLRTRGRYILCTDEEMSVPIAEVEKMLPYAQAGADLVLGLPMGWGEDRQNGNQQSSQQSVFTKVWRRGLGINYPDDKSATWFAALMGIRYRGCLLKLFRRDAARCIAGAQKLYGRSFDLEQLYLAWALGFSIRKVRVECRPQPGSRVHCEEPGRDESRSSPRQKGRVASARGQIGLGNPLHLLIDALKIIYTHRNLRRLRQTPSENWTESADRVV